MSTTVQLPSGKTLVEKKTRYRINYPDLRDLLFTLLGFEPEGDALKRLYKIANSVHDSIAARNAALQQFAQEELAPVEHPLRSTLDRIDSFSVDHPTALAPGAPVPWLETNRPAWADRMSDQAVFDTGDTVAGSSSMSWRSSPVSVALSDYPGKWQKDGRFTFADLRLDCRQATTDREPRIGVERHSWNGEGAPVRGGFYSLTVNEAASMARALLLLVDLATGTSDEIAGPA